MSKGFNTIGIIGKVKEPKVIPTLQKAVEHLTSKKSRVILEEKSAQALNMEGIPLDQFATDCDLVIIIGGDGSLIQNAHLLKSTATPIVGINRGNLGFLTDITPKDLEKQLDNILDNEYHTETRFFLDAVIKNVEGDLLTGSALNEVTLLRDSQPHMIDFDIYLNDDFLCHEKADGMIIASPTGSTAYALSGGGPIIHPSLNALLLLPMFSHTLNSRPLVIDADTSIRLVFTKINAAQARVSCDSQSYFTIAPGTEITIQKSKDNITLLHPNDYNYFNALQTKLHWNAKPHANTE